MTVRFKMLLAAMAAILALSFAVGTASALRSLSIDGPTTLVLNGNISFNSTEGTVVNCNATITKTVSRVIPKIDHILVGKVTRIDVERTIPSATCRVSGGLTLRDIVFLNLEREEFGRILKGTILGTLPTITGILFLIDRLQGRFTTNITGECEYESEGTEVIRDRIVPVLATVSGGVIGDLTFHRGNISNVIRNPFGLCPRSGELTGTMRPLQRTRIILI